MLCCSVHFLLVLAAFDDAAKFRDSSPPTSYGSPHSQNDHSLIDQSDQPPENNKYGRYTIHLTLKMTSAQVVETSVSANNSSFQNYNHPDDHTRQTTDTPGFKPFTLLCYRTITPDKLLTLTGSYHLQCYFLARPLR